MPTSEALKMEIAAGKNSGSGISAEIVFARLEAKYEQQAKSIFSMKLRVINSNCRKMRKAEG